MRGRASKRVLVGRQKLHQRSHHILQHREAQHFEAQLHLAASEDALPGVLRGRIAHAEGHVWAATVWRDQAASR